MYDTKIINSKCICNNQFIISDKIVVSMCPCEHLIHLDCISKHCPFCKATVTKYVKLGDHKNDYKCTQQCIDILSVTADKKRNTNIVNCLSHIPNFFDIATKFIFAKTNDDYHNMISSMLSMVNYSIKIKGLSKIQNSDKKIFIANHCGHLDAVLLYYFLKCGFLATIHNKATFDNIPNIVPIVYIKRGEKQNTVKTMKDFVDKHGSICIFPEGAYSGFGTMFRFRSGAFKIGYPIYPIVLKYKNSRFACDRCDVLQVALQYSSHNYAEMEIEILDPVYPPFNNHTPEQIRTKMANNGNFVLSRVLANDIKD